METIENGIWIVFTRKDIEVECNKDVGPSLVAVATVPLLTFEPPLSMTQQARPDAEIAGQPRLTNHSVFCVHEEAVAQLIDNEHKRTQSPGVA